MTVRTIENLDNPVLRAKARPVTRLDGRLQQLVDDMIETMRAASGVGLAGPQVNESLRVAVVETMPEYDDEGSEIEGSRELYVLVNPEIVWESHEVADAVEGCLSIPGWVGEVSRHNAIRVRALDRHGKKVRYRFKDWTARIVQHEIDHLNGVLYIDRLTAPDRIWREEEYFDDHPEQEAEELPVG
jgi:peptide deformylase